ncbi:maleylpyruvate isomerase N-terminal domain-containing protein, partial [Nonomuraea sp. NPDC055795]
MTDIFGDLEAEYRQLDSVLAALTPAQWSHPSAAEGWTVSDVVLHLAQTEELVTASLDGHDGLFARDPAVSDVDGMAAGLVAAQRDITPDALLVHEPEGVVDVGEFAGCPAGLHVLDVVVA